MSVTIEKQGLPKEVPQQDKDAFITSQVRVLLRTDPAFSDKILIKTDKGIVTLSGAVADENAKASLESKAKSVQGVEAVKNDLKIEKK